MAELAPHQRAFLRLLMAREALRFGDFTLKSGRKSPYFVNTGRLSTGGDLGVIGAAYAECIQRVFGDDVAVIFGPAYKGIPLAIASAGPYEEAVGHAVGWAYDRKEAKTHGDGGSFVGASLEAGTPVVVVDDVLTAGTALRETLAKLQPLGVDLRGAVVAVDRQEPGPHGRDTARREIAEDHGLPVEAIVSISQAVQALRAPGLDGVDPLPDALADRIEAHLGGFSD